jgi:TRAP-type C4-dicarboxylate transport system permease large subunit
MDNLPEFLTTEEKEIISKHRKKEKDLNILSTKEKELIKQHRKNKEQAKLKIIKGFGISFCIVLLATAIIKRAVSPLASGLIWVVYFVFIGAIIYKKYEKEIKGFLKW